MTRTSPRAVPTRRTGNDLDAWLLGDPDLDDGGLVLLAAYREATEAARKTVAIQPAEDQAAVPADGDVQNGPVSPARSQPAVPRLRIVEGIDDDRLAGLHGQLIAAGYLTAEVVGRSDGLSYRVTREGLRRLAGETDAEAA